MPTTAASGPVARIYQLNLNYIHSTLARRNAEIGTGLTRPQDVTVTHP